MSRGPADHRPGCRQELGRARRIVVKIGSSSLTRPDGGLDLNRLDSLAGLLADLEGQGKQTILVSSGAVAAGLTPLGLDHRPRELAQAQAAAALGQGLLLAHWRSAFMAHYRHVAQVLLTVGDITRRSSYLNARQALEYLLGAGVVPVVNENDTVATDQLRFGDNDRLAALVAQMLRADLLVLLTDVDALYDAPPSSPGASRIDTVSDMSTLARLRVTGRGSELGTGGMVTKIDAAQIAAACGIPVLLAAAGDAADALGGADVGTWFAASPQRRASRLAWIANAAHVAGRVRVDRGAARALRGGSSLLLAGVTDIAGAFKAGDVVDIQAGEALIGRGIAGLDADVAVPAKGLSSPQLRRVDPEAARPLIHRDDMVIFGQPQPA